jgi:predicted transposase YbfD/YdcC
LQAGGSEVVAVDGKTARRSFDHQGGRRPLHMVSAWGVGQQLVLGQQKVGDQSNEIEAVPELLALLALEGRIVTADAMHCQRATAQTILDRGGDYVLALKGNQPALFADVRLWLDDPATAVDDVHQTVDGDHGRIETRRAAVSHDVAWLTEAHDFPGLAAVAKVTATREIKGKSSTASRYYLLSKPLDAARLAEVVRTHWQIENCLHWVLDVVMDEDQSRSRKDHAPRKPRSNAPLRAQSHPRQQGQRLHPRQDQTRRLGRHLPAEDPHRRLMRLPCGSPPRSWTVR